MSKNIYVTVTSKKPGDKTNCVQLSVSHDKSRKAVFLSAYPATQNEDGQVIVAITQGKYHLYQPMLRLNRNKLEAVQQQAELEINHKQGPAFDLVKQLCDERGLALS